MAEISFPRLSLRRCVTSGHGSVLRKMAGRGHRKKMVPVRCPVWDSPTPRILTFLSLERGAPSSLPLFISPRESNRAIDATAIIRNRPRRCCLAGNDIRVFHLLVALLVFPRSRNSLFSLLFFIREWKRTVDASCRFLSLDSKELDIELEI